MASKVSDYMPPARFKLQRYAFGSDKEEIEVLAATYLNAEIARAKSSLHTRGWR